MLNGSLSRKTWLAWVALGVGLLATVFGSLHVKRDIEQAAVRQFAFACDQVTFKIQDRLGSYALILRGGGALFAASVTVERNEWKAYVETLRVGEKLPGVQGVGFAQIIPAAELATHIATIRAEGFPEYTVRPAGERPIYTSIIYIEPFRDRNLSAFGFDMFSEPVRRAAMEQARDTGKAVLSGKVELVQETDDDVQAGTLMYVPVYRNGAPVDTVGQRRAALIGWVYSPYRMNDFMIGILHDWVVHEGKDVDLNIYDGREATPATLLFDSISARSHDLHSLFYQQRMIDFNGHQWLLVFDHTAKLSYNTYASAWVALTGGLALSGLLFGLMLSVINTKISAICIADKLTEQIRRDEELLKQSEVLKFAIMNSLPSEIAVVNHEGAILAVNEPWWRFALEHGIGPFKKPATTSAIGANYLALCQLDSGFITTPDAWEASSGVQAVLDGSLPSFSMEYPRPTPTEQQWISMTVLPLGLGAIRAAVISHTDITERKTAETAIAESRNLLLTVIDSAPLRVYWKDRNLRYLGCNMAFAKDAGMTHPNDVIGKDDSQLGWADQSDLYHADDLAVMESGIAKLAYEEPQTTPDGQPIWLRLSKVLLRNQDNEVFGLLGIYEDITKHKQAEQELQISEARLSIITASANDAIIMLDEAGNITFWNQAAEKLFGFAREEVIGRNMHEMFAPLRFREAHRRAFQHFQQTGQGEAVGKTLELVGLRKDSSEFSLELSLSAVQVKGVWQSIGILRDITERKQAEEKLQLSASVFTHAHEGIMLTAADGTIIDVNDAFSNITSYSRDEVLGQNPRLLSSGRQEKEFYAAMWQELVEKGDWYGEIWNRRKSGEMYAVMQTISAVRDAQGNIHHYVSLLSDITLIKEHEQELDRNAHYDALTGLPNRVLLAERLQQGIAQARRRGQLLAVAFLDLDGFKAINDNYGHEAGDHLLITVATRMKHALRDSDTLARIGGDEFVAELLDLTDIEGCEPLLTRLLAAAAEPVHYGDHVLQVSASLGVTFYPQAEDLDADQLIRQADQAMYQAKQAGKSRWHIFDVEQDRSVRGHHESLERIRCALSSREFELYYQPKVNMRTGIIIGAEALIRWQHPERGLLLPDDILPVIEDNPLSIELGEWVIDAALLQIEIWHAAGLNIPVSVNVSHRQLQQADFVERLRVLMAAHPNVRPGDLELEVQETSALKNMARVSQVIEACREIGVRFAMDDFGTGYSSLTYLKQLPVNTIKIDQTFVLGILDNLDDRAIMKGVLSLSAAFHREVIAEGVETIEYGLMLLKLGCDLAQGYGIAHPMPAHEFPGWSADWRPDPSWVGV